MTNKNNNSSHNRNNNTEGNITVAKSEQTDLSEFLSILHVAIGQFLGADGDAPVKAKGKASKATEADDVDEADDADDTESEGSRSEREAELKTKRITSLRKIALDLGFDDDDVKDADKDALIEGILDDEFPESASEDDEDEDEEPEEEEEEEEEESEDDEDDADEDEDEEDEDEAESDDDTYSRDELEDLSLKDLKGVAKESGYSAADLKGMDQEAIIDMLLDGEESSDDGEDEDEADEDESDGDFYSEEDLSAMSLRELKALAKEWEVDVPAGTKKGELVGLLLAE